MTYDLLQAKNVTTMLKIFQVANDYSNQTFTVTFMFAIFIIMLLSLKRFPFDQIFPAASFACFVLSMLLVYAGLLNFLVMLLFLAFTGVSMFYLFITNNS